VAFPEESSLLVDTRFLSMITGPALELMFYSVVVHEVTWVTAGITRTAFGLLFERSDMKRSESKRRRRQEMFGRMSVLITAIGVVISITAGNLYASSVWDNRGIGNSFGLEILRPSFPESGYWNRSGLAVFLSGRLEINPSAAIVAEIPYAHGSLSQRPHYYYGYEGYYYPYGRYLDIQGRKDAVGNIYLGAELFSFDARSCLELGIRFPTAPEEDSPANSVGRLADHQRLEAFLADQFSVNVMANYRHRSENGFQTRFLIGPNFLLSRNKRSSGVGLQFVVHGGAQLAYESRAVSIGSGITATLRSMSSGYGESESGIQLEIRAAYKGATRARPGLSLRKPLAGNEGGKPDLVIGLNVEFLLGHTPQHTGAGEL
jgi:hypothetical protein